MKAAPLLGRALVRPSRVWSNSNDTPLPEGATISPSRTASDGRLADAAASRSGKKRTRSRAFRLVIGPSERAARKPSHLGS
jgi:hypothetical protein